MHITSITMVDEEIFVLSFSSTAISFSFSGDHVQGRSRSQSPTKEDWE